MASQLSELESLQSHLNVALDALKAELKANNLPELSSSGVRPHPLDDGLHLITPRYYEARKLAGRLNSLIQFPFEKITELQYTGFEQAGIDLVVRKKIVEVLADESPDPSVGLSVQVLGEKLNIDAGKLCDVMRLLAVAGWFIETSEGVFANARPALQLREGLPGWKSTQAVKKNPIADALVETLISNSPRTAFQLSQNTDLSFFEYHRANPTSLKTLGYAVEALGDTAALGLVNDYPWASLGSKTVIDCGGGSGTFTIALARASKDTKLKFIIQDLEEVIARAKVHVAKAIPEAIESSQVSFEVHDFFQPQPHTGDDYIFVFRWVFHNWPDSKSLPLLQNTAKALGAGAKILIVESIILPGIPSSSSSNDAKSQLDALEPGKPYHAMTAPPYIPTNFGEATRLVHSLGVHMVGCLNAHERTLSEWESLLAKAGLKIGNIYYTRSPLSVIEVVLDR